MPLIVIVKAFILSWLCSRFRSGSISIIEGIKILLKPSLVLSNTFFFKYLECKVILVSSKLRLWSSYIIVLWKYEHKNLARNIIELLLDVNLQLWGQCFINYSLYYIYCCIQGVCNFLFQTELVYLQAFQLQPFIALLSYHHRGLSAKLKLKYK